MKFLLSLILLSFSSVLYAKCDMDEALKSTMKTVMSTEGLFANSEDEIFHNFYSQQKHDKLNNKYHITLVWDSVKKDLKSDERTYNRNYLVAFYDDQTCQRIDVFGSSLDPMK